MDISKNKGTSVKEKKDGGHLELISNNWAVDNETVMMMKGSYRVRQSCKLCIIAQEHAEYSGKFSLHLLAKRQSMNKHVNKKYLQRKIDYYLLLLLIFTASTVCLFTVDILTLCHSPVCNSMNCNGAHDPLCVCMRVKWLYLSFGMQSVFPQEV